MAHGVYIIGILHIHESFHWLSTKAKDQYWRCAINQILIAKLLKEPRCNELLYYTAVKLKLHHKAIYI